MEQSSLACPGGLLVYVASNPLRGISQLLRSLTLAQQWLKEGGKVVYVADRLPRILAHQITTCGCQFHWLESRPTEDGFAVELCQFADLEGCGWIALDDSDDNLIRRVSDLRSIHQKVLVLGESNSVADFCTDSNPAFALIRDSIQNDQTARTSNCGATRCVLDFSRMDRNQVFSVLRQLLMRFGDRQIKFELVSSFAPQVVDQIKNEYPGFWGDFESHFNVDRVFQNLTGIQLVISTDESSFYETAFSGLPSILLTEKAGLADLAPQLTTLPWLVNRNRADWIEQTEAIMEQLLNDDRCRKQHGQQMVKLVDSQASVRLCQLMKRLAISPRRVRSA